MRSRLIKHVEGNVVGYLALFVALGGTTYAATTAPKNSVVTKSIKKGAVTNAKLAKSAVTSAKVKDGSLTAADIDVSTLPKLTAVPHATTADSATRATTADSATKATTADTATKATTAESAASAANADTLGGAAPADFLKGAGTVAGGSLTGTYAQPSLKPDSVASANVAANALTGADIDEATLSDVNAATLGGRNPFEFVTRGEGGFSLSGVLDFVDTEAAANNVVVVRNIRYTVETTGTAHQFKVCTGDTSVSVTQYFVVLHGAGRSTYAVPDNSCSPAFATGGSGTTTPGNFTIYGPEMIVQGGPSTLSNSVSQAHRYTVMAQGFDVSAQ